MVVGGFRSFLLLVTTMICGTVWFSFKESQRHYVKYFKSKNFEKTHR